ncbi:MAG: Gfo/Idh/MocA family oxidoreductase [Kiritimatiellae bacterium]|nr:Gfo/Idh/MocA family oxidoreductase [Kiritimatiellia bacterium]
MSGDGKVKIGIIGAGQIGKVHMGRWEKVPGVEIVGVADVNEEEAKRVAAARGFAHAFKDYHDLLKLGEVQAVDVCVHNNLHAPISIAAMEAGKEVYCEKPLAGSYADAARMVAKAGELGRKLYMQAGGILAPETMAAKRLIDDGQLGKLYYAKSSHYRRRGRCYVDGYGSTSFVQKKVAAGGALYDMGIYAITKLLYLLGNPEVLTISGSTFQEIPMYEERRKQSQFDVEELAVAIVRMAGGITFFIEEAWAIHLGGTDGNKIVGSKGGLTLEPFAFHTTLSDMEMDATVNVKALMSRWGSCFPESQLSLDREGHWAAALRGETELLPTAAIGLNMMLIAEGVYLSQQLGREVTADEVKKHSKSTALKV